MEIDQGASNVFMAEPMDLFSRHASNARVRNQHREIVKAFCHAELLLQNIARLAFVQAAPFAEKRRLLCS
ncbi:MAG: hypothetical protein ABIS07_03200 [Dokdonella sp.]